MSYHKNIFILFFIAIFIAGCSTKTSYPVVVSKPKPSTHATMRPYKIIGKTYYPKKVEV